jgi:hypothetical protein
MPTLTSPVAATHAAPGRVYGALRTLASCLCAILCTTAGAQELEPRSYTNLPVGLNFLVLGYAFTDGTVAFDPALPLTDAKLRTNTGVLAYARALDAWGYSAKFDVVVPFGGLEGSALYQGVPQTRDVSGFGDPRFRFAINLLGAPALSPREFASFRQDLIVGASLQVSAPWGQYDNTRLVNIGTNRWSFKTEVGASKAVGPWTFEIASAVTLFTRNDDFLSGGTLSQDPLYSVQGHLIRSFSQGVWAALDATWYAGGNTSVNGAEGQNRQSNARFGATLTLPIDRRNSIKLYASTGAYSRTDSDFDAFGVVWQHRWGAGL